MLDVLLGASGGIFGILGALVKHGLEVYQEGQKEERSLAVLKETHAHELAMADKEAKIMQFEADNDLVLAKVKASGEIEQAGIAALSTSYETDKSTYSQDPTNPWLVAVDVVRGMIRPSLTMYFAVFLTLITIFFWQRLPMALYSDPKFLESTFYRLVDALIFLATSAIGWYFAARPSSNSSS